MRILHLSFSLLNGGKENMMIDIANEQYKLGHNVAILVVNKDIEKTIINRTAKGVKTYLLRRKPGSKSPLPFIKLFQILHFTFRPDINHSHDAHLGRLLKILFAKKVVLTIHGPGININSMNHFDKLYAISNSVKQDVETRSHLNCKVVYNGIKINDIRKKENYDFKQPLKIVLVKRLNHKRKGQDLLIEATKILVKKHGQEYVKVDFAGDGDSFTYLNDLVKKYKLEKNITFLGNKNRDWVYDNLFKYDVFVHPSRFEGFGLTITEAMAASIPVISSNIEGPAEIIQNKYGLLFKNNDVEGLVKKIEETFEMHKSNNAQEFTSKALEYCQNNFDIKLTASNYCKNY